MSTPINPVQIAPFSILQIRSDQLPNPRTLRHLPAEADPMPFLLLPTQALRPPLPESPPLGHGFPAVVELYSLPVTGRAVKSETAGVTDDPAVPGAWPVRAAACPPHDPAPARRPGWLMHHGDFDSAAG